MKSIYCELLKINPEKMADMVCNLDIGGAISQDYIRPIVESLVDDIAQDIYETADCEEWNYDDIRLAFGRVLCKKLGIEI